MLRFSVLALSVVSLLATCTIDPYEAGDGQYSYLKAEMADMRTAVKRRIGYVMTGTDKRLTFSPPFGCHWATTPDSTYRTILYYKESPDKTEGNICVKVWVLCPMKPSKDTPADSTKLQNGQLNQNKKYINLRLGIMSGKPNDEKQEQKIGIVLNKQVTHTNGEKVIDLQLLHNRNRVPSYYTNILYISIPTTSYKSGDSIRLKVNAYQGMVEKTFVLQAINALSFQRNYNHYRLSKACGSHILFPQGLIVSREKRTAPYIQSKSAQFLVWLALLSVLP